MDQSGNPPRPDEPQDEPGRPPVPPDAEDESSAAWRPAPPGGGAPASQPGRSGSMPPWYRPPRESQTGESGPPASSAGVERVPDEPPAWTSAPPLPPRPGAGAGTPPPAERSPWARPAPPGGGAAGQPGGSEQPWARREQAGERAPGQPRGDSDDPWTRPGANLPGSSDEPVEASRQAPGGGSLPMFPTEMPSTAPEPTVESDARAGLYGAPGGAEAPTPPPPWGGSPSATVTPADAGAAQLPPPPPPAAPATVPAEPPARFFGDRMAAGVLLTLGALSVLAGGLFGLVASGDSLSDTWRAVVCGGVAAVLLAGAVGLRLVRGSEDLRGTLAVLGIAYATACWFFAWMPADATPHDLLVKFAVGAGIVAVLGWAACVAVPSAITGALGVMGLSAGIGAAVWLGFESPTQTQVFVAVMCAALALAVALPRVPRMRPHPTGLGWTLGAVALVLVASMIFLVLLRDTMALAAEACASAGALALAQRQRHLPMALTAFAGLSGLEGELLRRAFTSTATSDTTQQVTVLVIGVVLLVVAGAGSVLMARRRTAMRWPVPLTLAELFFAAAFVLALVAMATGPGELPSTPIVPTQLQTEAGSTAVHAAPATPGAGAVAMDARLHQRR